MSKVFCALVNLVINKLLKRSPIHKLYLAAEVANMLIYVHALI